MKKTALLLLALAAFATLQAQWVDDPVNNTLIANASEYAGEVYLATDEATGDTYVQWTAGFSNGYAPALQRLAFDGTPQWGSDGIHIAGHNFPSSSEGFAMTVTADHAVVSSFATATDQTYAVKINADGTFAWGEQGVLLFDGNGFSRTELVAGDDGGVWALGFDYHRHYLQYVNADGSLNPTILVDNEGYDEMYGKLTLGVGNTAFLTYERVPENPGMWTDKSIFLVGYTTDGIQIGPEAQLMSSQTFQITYIHHVVPDGLGGGYAYIWHSGIGGTFNTYVSHYDANGFSTISDLDGISVHSQDPSNHYLDAYATVDPKSHDLIIAYIKENSTQSQDRICVNRITATGERVWGEGIVVADYIGSDYANLKVDAFEDGDGFTLVYEKGAANPYFTTVEALGLDMDGNILWSKTLSSSAYSRSFCKNSAGFHLGQNIVAWVNGSSGGLYGQNIGPDGAMGPIEIPEPCYAPENFEGSYLYLEDSGTFGAMLTWDAPETQPLWYNLYITLPDGNTIHTEIEPTETEYFHEMTVSATITYRLTASYEYCDSDFALTPDGEDHVDVYITDRQENTNKEIVTVLRIISASGQTLTCKSLDDLSAGIYILQGLTEDGRMVSRKVFVRGE